MWVHMVQHSLLGLLVPLLLVLAAPLTLALQSAAPPTRRSLRALLRSRPAHVIAHPVVAWALFGGGLVVIYLTSLLDLSVRTFHCSRCGHEADRDTNAAANLASYHSSGWPHVAAKHAETTNACGEGSAGARLVAVCETALDEAGTAPAERPSRAVVTETVNTL